jgi:hypothetical protein
MIKNMIKPIFISLSAATFSALLSATPAHASSVTVGTNDPSAGNCYPYSCYVIDGYNTYQEAYASSAFPSAPITINSFDLFASTIDFGGNPLDTASFDVYFSTSNFAANALSSIFANNIGADNSLFGTFSLSGNIQPVTTFTATTPFTYDPSQGDLLMYSVLTSGTTDGFYGPFFQADYTGSNVVSRVVGNSPVGTYLTTGALVTRFNFTPATSSVPGPLPFLGVAAAFGYSRKLRKRMQTCKLPVNNVID